VKVMASFPDVIQYFTLADFGEYASADEKLIDLEDSYVAVAELKPRCKAIRLFAASGILLTGVVDGRRDYHQLDVSEAGWFQAALNASTDDTLLSEVHPDVANGLPVLSVCQPVRLHGRTAGVLAIDVLARELAQDLMPAVRASAGGHVYLLGLAGCVLASEGPGAPSGDLSAWTTTRRVLAGHRDVTVVTNEDGSRMHVAYLPQASTGLGLVLSVPEDALLGPVDRMRNTVVALTVACILMVALLGLGIVRRIVQPLRLLTSGAARVAEGDLDQFVDVRTGDELEDLAQSFNKMSRSLREAVDAKDRRAGELEAAVTDLQETHRQLAQAEKMGLLGQLAGGIAHDFNNLLTGILGCADLLKRGSDTPEDKARHIDIILNAARRAADLVQQLLAFARPGKTQQDMVDLNELVNEVVRILGRTVGSHIVVEKQLHAGPAMTMGDSSELQSALLNLGVNARDAIDGSGTITYTTEVVELDAETCRLQAHPMEPGPYLEIGVADTGTGMSPEVLEHIFEPFYTTKEVGKGTGLGLAAVYGTVRGHDGSINVYSDPGRGTQFRLFFPLTSDEQAGDAPSRADLVHGTGTILLVDDEPIIRNLGSNMLKSFGYEVILAADGEEALETWDARRGEIDLVILDLVMPGKNGEEVLREIRGRDPDATVLITSGFQFERNASDLRRAGAAGFLPKPFIATSLSRAIAAALAPSRSGRSLRVLCADDSAVNREVLNDVLVELGHEVVLVEDGLEALEAARRQRIDLVLMDLEMPRMGGLEAARKLREQYGDRLPILGMSGEGSEVNQERCTEAGMDVLLRKPLTLDVLQSAIDSRLGRGPSRGAHDETLAARLAKAFVEEAPQLMDQLREAVGRGDAVAVHRSAHTLHGSLRHFDATLASELSDRLQCRAREEDLDQAVQLTEQLAEECARLMKVLENGKGGTR
jgi:signal transduction histidine kinase/CheY-like chemotaxis protein